MTSDLRHHNYYILSKLKKDILCLKLSNLHDVVWAAISPPHTPHHTGRHTGKITHPSESARFGPIQSLAVGGCGGKKRYTYTFLPLHSVTVVPVTWCRVSGNR
jgi:hypothetical protein